MQGVKITSFTLTIGDTEMTTCNVITDQMRELISKLKPLERIFFDDIKAEGPDKRIRNMGTLTLRVN